MCIAQNLKMLKGDEDMAEEADYLDKMKSLMTTLQ